jgi:hypothetical protein
LRPSIIHYHLYLRRNIREVFSVLKSFFFFSGFFPAGWPFITIKVVDRGGDTDPM